MGHDGGRQRRVVPLRRRVQGSVGTGEGQVRRRFVEQLDALALRGEDVPHRPAPGRVDRTRIRPPRPPRGDCTLNAMWFRIDPSVPPDGVPPVEEDQHVGERDHGRLPERAALAGRARPRTGRWPPRRARGSADGPSPLRPRWERQSAPTPTRPTPRPERLQARDLSLCMVSSPRAATLQAPARSRWRRIEAEGPDAPGFCARCEGPPGNEPRRFWRSWQHCCRKPCSSATYLPVSWIHGRRSWEGRTALRDRP